MVNNGVPKNVVHQTDISVPCTGQLCLHVDDFFFFRMRNENQGKKEKGRKKEKKEKKENLSSQWVAEQFHLTV